MKIVEYRTARNAGVPLLVKNYGEFSYVLDGKTEKFVMTCEDHRMVVTHYSTGMCVCNGKTGELRKFTEITAKAFLAHVASVEGRWSKAIHGLPTINP